MLAHLLNLIIKDCLNDVMTSSISRICDVVRYIRGSTVRAEQFRTCVDQDKSQVKVKCVLSFQLGESSHV